MGVDASDVEWEATETSAVSQWLARQQVGTVRIASIGPFVDVEHDAALVEFDKHPLVRDAIAQFDPSGHLDTGLIRLGGPHGRRITQAVGVAVREWRPRALGVGYHSRLATDEMCWAIWESTRVDVASEALSPGDDQHRDAVMRVATLFEIDLPVEWLVNDDR